MSSAVQSSGNFPETLREWEYKLTTALLRADDGNADAIRSFEITPETLAEHCGFGIERAADAVQAFRRALLADPHLTWCLQHGAYRSPGIETPNCMAFLALSLLVDSLLDGDYEDKGQYRAKLGQWLGIERSFMDLRGIAIMWDELVTWLDARVTAGAPFRRLILPEIPATWTHIGYTRYLSFPTKRDLRFLRKQIERNPQSANDPVALVRLLDPTIRSSPVSFGLKNAFEDFRTALRSGGASVDHRFWRLVGRARALVGQKDAALAELWMEFDEDGERRYRVSSGVTSGTLVPFDISTAVALSALIESPNLGPSIRRGVLFFRSGGLASWSAAGEPPSGIGPFHLAIADRHYRLAAGTLARFEKSGSWFVTIEPVPPSTVSDVLRRLGIHNARESVRTIGLVGGVHVGKAWLGLPRYLPHLEGVARGVEIRPIAGSASSLTCVDNELKADTPVEGEFAIDDKAGCWSRRVTFLPMAEAHVSMDGASYLLPELEEWQTSKSNSLTQVSHCDLNWDGKDYLYQDVLEALYASAGSGIDEGNAVAIIDRAAGRRSWEMLRTLQESTFLDARLRLRWRGRVFTLGHPSLTEMRIGTAPGVIVSGAVPARLEEEFCKTVELQGGLPFRRLREGSFGPPLIGATRIDAKKLSDALGWRILPPPFWPDGVATNRLLETRIVGESYQFASAWEWSIGRFRAGSVPDAPVSLVRLVHPGGRDHDLYRVTGRRRRQFTSRHAAIVDAHVQAGRPLFRSENSLIRRIASEGALPIEVARALRLRTLLNGGASNDGWDYALALREQRWLAGLLPSLIDGLGSARSADSTLTYRRGRGPRRPVWTDGGIAV